MMLSLVKSIAKRIPSKVLLPTLVEMWTTGQHSRQSVSFTSLHDIFIPSNEVHKTTVSAYFEVVARALQHADRSTVMECLRGCFKNFLDALDISQVDKEVRNITEDPTVVRRFILQWYIQVETRVISAFKQLVIKLNEAAFRPLFRRLYDWAFTVEPGTFVVFIYLGFTNQFNPSV